MLNLIVVNLAQRAVTAQRAGHRQGITELARHSRLFLFF